MNAGGHFDSKIKVWRVGAMALKTSATGPAETDRISRRTKVVGRPFALSKYILARGTSRSASKGQQVVIVHHKWGVPSAVVRQKVLTCGNTPTIRRHFGLSVVNCAMRCIKVSERISAGRSVSVTCPLSTLCYEGAGTIRGIHGCLTDHFQYRPRVHDFLRRCP